MSYNFDEAINRSHTNCYKWDFLQDKFNSSDLLPLWVADMDFPIAEEIQLALQERLKHPVYGYSFRSDVYYNSFIKWMKNRFHFSINREDIIDNPGVVPALNIAIQTFTKIGDKILIQTPIYPPFIESVNLNKRSLVISELINQDCYYTMNFDDIEAKFRTGVKMMLLCSPHNPVGRVWQSNELKQLLYLANKYHVMIVSDEIHADLVFKPHTPMLTLPDSEEKVIILTSPGKTFNIAGICGSFAIIKNKKIRNEFENSLQNLHLFLGNIFGMVAMEAAYCYGDKWLSEVLHYLQANYKFLRNFLDQTFPEVQVTILEGTYLSWLDFKQLGFTHNELVNRLINHCKVGLNSGTDFGKIGNGFMRLNFACSRSTLEKALNRIVKVKK